MNHIKRVVIISLIFGLMGFLYCGKKVSPSAPSDVDVSGYITQGWTYFEQVSPNYTQALEQFNQAISANPKSADAYVGRGWVYAQMAFGLNDVKYNQAKSDFSSAAALSPLNTDARAGLTLVLAVLNEYQRAIVNADSVLTINPNYQFVHDGRITAAVLKLVKTQCCFYLGRYDDVAALLNQLQPGVSHPANKPDVLLSQIQELTEQLIRE